MREDRALREAIAMRPSNQPISSKIPAVCQPAAVATTTPAPAARDIPAAMRLIPSGAFVLTSAYGETRAGVIVRWVQQVSSSPPLVVVAIEKGQPLSPIIRDSRRFALCQLAAEDRVLHRMFEPERHDLPKQPQGSRTELMDPFLGLSTRMTAAGVPVLLKSLAWLECELTRHLDVEGNCELYIGLVHDGGVLRTAEPPIDASAVACGSPPTNGQNGNHRNGNGNGHGHANGNGAANGNGVAKSNGRGSGAASTSRRRAR